MTPTEQLVATHVGNQPIHNKKLYIRGEKQYARNPRVSMYTDEQWEFVFGLMCYGYSYQELADWLGVSPSLLRHHFRRLGLVATLRPPLSTFNEKFWKIGDSDARP